MTVWQRKHLMRLNEELGMMFSVANSDFVKMGKVGNTNIIISPYWNYLEELPPLEVPLEFGWGDEILGGKGGGCCCLSFKLFQPAGDPLEGGDTQFLKRGKYVSNNIEIYCEKLLGHMTKGTMPKNIFW